MQSYPIDSSLPALKRAVLEQSAVILHAPPGAGKTTRVPLALLDVLRNDQGNIVMLEPRRIAAVSAARWMARQLNEPVGETIGYAIRFDAKRSSRTRVEVVTDGVFTRRIQSDPGLDGVSVVIFDEFHERSMNADLAMALCLDVRKQLRPDLKIVVMSATLDHGPLAALLDDAAVIRTSGRAFPVEERYLEYDSDHLSSRISSAVRTALQETNGDILVFLPGAGEIRSCLKSVRENIDPLERISLHALYGDLPFEEQEQAILPNPTLRKIVFATNIAETSLTIEGVHVVVDCGLTRMLRYDPATGMNRLVTVRTSQASAEQRKGRAGRLGPGVCYRLYSKQDLRGMVPFAQPEIQVSDLSPLVLETAAWGVREPRDLSWIDLPPRSSWDSGARLLQQLGALDAQRSITRTGRAMAGLPLHPRLSCLLARAGELGQVRLGAHLAALLSERDIFRSHAAERMRSEPDIMERIAAFSSWIGHKGAVDRMDPGALKSVERISQQLLRLTPGMAVSKGTDQPDTGSVSRLLLSAYPDRICKRREEQRRGYILSHGRELRLPPDSHLINDLYLIAVQVDAGTQAEGVIYLACAVTEKMIRSECGVLIETVKRVAWNRKEERIDAGAEERIGAILISKKQLMPDDETVARVLCEEIHSSPAMLQFTDDDYQFMGRVSLMKRTFPEESWPELSQEHLAAHPEVWIAPWLGSVRTLQQLRSLKLYPALKSLLTREQQRLLDTRAPFSLIVPSGNRIQLDYAAGNQPILAVKLQEVFGLTDTPRIAENRVPVLLHLLSPARRPVQITQDLRAFWNSGYQLIRKDLKGRYPKHPWPDDPWSAEPTARARPRRS